MFFQGGQIGIPPAYGGGLRSESVMVRFPAILERFCGVIVTVELTRQNICDATEVGAVKIILLLNPPINPFNLRILINRIYQQLFYYLEK